MNEESAGAALHEKAICHTSGHKRGGGGGGGCTFLFLHSKINRLDTRQRCVCRGEPVCWDGEKPHTSGNNTTRCWLDNNSTVEKWEFKFAFAAWKERLRNCVCVSISTFPSQSFGDQSNWCCCDWKITRGWQSTWPSTRRIKTDRWTRAGRQMDTGRGTLRGCLDNRSTMPWTLSVEG